MVKKISDKIFEENMGDDLEKTAKALEEVAKSSKKAGQVVTKLVDAIEELKKIEKDTASFLIDIFETFSKAMLRVYFVMVLLLGLCFSFLLISETYFNHERLVFASTGVLMFISVFYSFLGKDEMKAVENLCDSQIKQLEESIREKWENLNMEKSASELETIIYDLKKELSKKLSEVKFVKQMSNIEFILFFAVSTLMISIIFSLFDSDVFKASSYLFFICGIVTSFVIVLDWTIIRRLLKKLDEKNL